MTKVFYLLPFVMLYMSCKDLRRWVATSRHHWLGAPGWPCHWRAAGGLCGLHCGGGGASFPWVGAAAVVVMLR